MPAAHRQRRRLTRGLIAFDPHHLGARHHHSRAGVSPNSNTDWIILRSSSATTPALLGQVDHLAQLDSEANGPFRNPRPVSARYRSTQQPADRGEQHRDRLQRKRGQQ